ncbi:unnamed protein product [Prorocentrum cordatum]|uniref:Peroxisomal membrane protein PEX16 n=1 Tax=Prorocentrum cordatum TaxID=2364126 RepID=A0ABN9VT59_9DINO|nr:unnamed protein product [Polarella glacialis]
MLLLRSERSSHRNAKRARAIVTRLCAAYSWMLLLRRDMPDVMPEAGAGGSGRWPGPGGAQRRALHIARLRSSAPQIQALPHKLGQGADRPGIPTGLQSGA